MGISTHVLDTTVGRPAAEVAVTLERSDGGPEGHWSRVGQGATDQDGRCKELLVGAPPEGTYRITFDVAGYFARTSTPAFYPEVSITFLVRASGEHYHVPLLLNPFGYSTYRGS